MKLRDAVLAFDEWSYPWMFKNKIMEMLKNDPNELFKAEAIYDEANKKENWFQVDRVIGCKITQNELRKRFPKEDEDVLACFVRAASYNWR